MKVEFISINHVCIVVKNIALAEKFYIGVLGLTRHPKISSWLIINETSTLHIVEIPEANSEESIFHEVQHFALQVKDLKDILFILLDNHLKPFQMDFKGNSKELSSYDDNIDYGIGTIFVHDPDKNLIEFIELNKGVFKDE